MTAAVDSLGACPVALMAGERRAEMYRVEIAADLNDEDHTVYLWTFLDEARNPAQVIPGALVAAGDEDAAAVCQVIDLVPAGDARPPVGSFLKRAPRHSPLAQWKSGPGVTGAAARNAAKL
jgi:hypothetical protein